MDECQADAALRAMMRRAYERRPMSLRQWAEWLGIERGK